MKSGFLLPLLALAAQPAKAAPMPAADFEQRFSALADDKAKDCLLGERQAARPLDEQLDKCIAAVTDIEARHKALTGATEAEAQIYLVLDAYEIGKAASIFSKIDNARSVRVCKAIRQQTKITRLINPDLYEKSVADQLQSMVDGVDAIDRQCQADYPEGY